jgi:hypothetical protein
VTRLKHSVVIGVYLSSQRRFVLPNLPSNVSPRCNTMRVRMSGFMALLPVILSKYTVFPQLTHQPISR